MLQDTVINEGAVHHVADPGRRVEIAQQVVDGVGEPENGLKLRKFVDNFWIVFPCVCLHILVHVEQVVEFRGSSGKLILRIIFRQNLELLTVSEILYSGVKLGENKMTQ